MQKVTYIISDINKAVFIENTALELRKRGVEIIVILINSENTSLDAFLKEHSFHTEYLEVKSIKSSIIATLKCLRLLKKYQTSIVHCHFGNATWIGLWAAKLGFIKRRIYTRHEGKMLHYGKKLRTIDKIQNYLATDIVAITKNTENILLNQGVKPNKIKFIHHGFILDRFKHSDQREVERIKKQYNPSNQFPIVGVVARWMEWKGIHYIITAFKEILKQYPEAKLMLFNYSENADYSYQLNEMLKEIPHKNYEKVVFEENVYDLFQLFDVYVHVPVDEECEAFGQTYIEALASGVPSIFTLSGIAREFITEDYAEVVPFRDSKAIQNALEKILANPAAFKAKKKIGLKFDQDSFDLKNYINDISNLYN
jgi:glycosyltransferase involved in cell wall biosynthesis